MMGTPGHLKWTLVPVPASFLLGEPPRAQAPSPDGLRAISTVEPKRPSFEALH